MTEESIKIRRYTFAFLSSLLFCATVIIDYYKIMDTCLFVYSCLSVMSFICWASYLAWWYIKRKATRVYAWITWLFLGIFITCTINLYARNMYIGSPLEYDIFRTTNLWEYRYFPEILGVNYMFSLILGRIFGKEDT